MFDQIGRRPDPEARKRDAASAVLTTALLAGVIGFGLGLAAWTVADPAPPGIDDVELVELVMADPQDPLVAPAAPGPRAPEQAAAAVRGEDLAPQGPPPDPDAPPRPLTDPPPDRVVSSAGHPQGTDEGDTDGVPGGTGTAGGTETGGGCLVPPCGDGPAVLHHSELEWRKKVLPRYPTGVGPDAPERVVCLVTVDIDAKGEPQWVTMGDCPATFSEEARRAMLRSRWYPPRVDGRKIDARTTIRIVFVRDQGG